MTCAFSQFVRNRLYNLADKLMAVAVIAAYYTSLFFSRSSEKAIKSSKRLW